MAEKPIAAFVLSLIGSIIFLLLGIFLFFLFFPLIGGLLTFIGALIMYSEKTEMVRTGSILVLVFSLISSIFTLGGFIVGFVLCLIGSILGLTWEPEVAKEPPPLPPF